VQKGQAHLLEQQIDPRASRLSGPRIEQPAPHDAGHDERDGHWEEEDAPEDRFAPHLLIQQKGESKTQQKAGGQEEDGEVHRVAQIDQKTIDREQPRIIAQSDQREIGRERGPLGQGRETGERNEAVNKDRYGDYRRGNQQE